MHCAKPALHTNIYRTQILTGPFMPFVLEEAGTWHALQGLSYAVIWACTTNAWKVKTQGKEEASLRQTQNGLEKPSQLVLRQVWTAGTPGGTSYYLPCSESLPVSGWFWERQRTWAPPVRRLHPESTGYHQAMMNRTGALTSIFPWPLSNQGTLRNNSGRLISLTKPQKAQLKLASLKLERNHHLSPFKGANWWMGSE